MRNPFKFASAVRGGMILKSSEPITHGLLNTEVLTDETVYSFTQWNGANQYLYMRHRAGAAPPLARNFKFNSVYCPAPHVFCTCIFTLYNVQYVELVLASIQQS